MVKKRQTKKAKSAGSTKKKRSSLDPKAPKNYKSLTMHMNEFEYTRFIRAAESAERGMLDFLRLALKRAIVAEIGD